jgi:Rhs element Vgr protein
VPSPANDAGSLASVSIRAGGESIDDQTVLVSVEVTKGVNRVPTARLVFLDGDMPNQTFPLSSSSWLTPGTEIEILAGYDLKTTSIFKGLVVRHSITITGSNDARLVIDCHDKAMKMTLGRRNANYLQQTDSDVITQLISNYGLEATVDATTVTHDELVQFYSTDWDFVLSRAEANGMIVVANDGKVTVSAPLQGVAPALTVTYGQDLMEFHGDIDARWQYTNVTGTCWNLDTLSVSSASAKPKTLNKQGNLASAALADVGGLSAFRLQSAVPLPQAALTAWVDAQQMKAGLARLQGRVTFVGNASAVPGGLITLAGLGDRFNGDAFVSVVRHQLAEGQWTTEAEFGLSRTWFTERRDLSAPPAGGLLPPVEGLQVGIVTKLDEDPEGQFRIQVSVPVMEAETATVWARLLKWYGSKGFGAFFIPEIGDEVVLGYFNNDPSHPVILGSLYSKTHAPAYTPTADNFTKALVTRSKLKVVFDDEKKIVTIETPAVNKVVLSDEDKQILLSDQNGNTVTLAPEGVTIDSPKDIKITAKGTITVDAVGKISVKSSADVSVSGLNVNHDAQVGFVGKGAATAELSASGQTTVKGALVMIN